MLMMFIVSNVVVVDAAVAQVAVVVDVSAVVVVFCSC